MRWVRCFGALCALMAFGSVAAGTLDVTVHGVQPRVGHVVVSLFDSKTHWLKKTLAEQRIPVGGADQVMLQFVDLPPGTYALSVYYDEDSNGRMNTGFMRIPSEPVGFSNRAKGLFGPPGFEKASFKFTDSGAVELILGSAKD